MLDITEVRYIPNDASSLITFPGKLVTSSTEPSLSVAEGKGLTEALEGERGTFTIITKDSRNQTTYSEIDQINVEINSKTNGTLKTTITDNQNGQYEVMYMSNEGGDFNVSITVKGEAIKGSPFRLTVTETTGSSLSEFVDTLNDDKIYLQSKATFRKQQRRMVLPSKLKAAADRSCWHSISLKDSLSGGASRETECPICLRFLTNPRTLKCKHVFCTNCAETALKHNNKCPVCNEVQGIVRGNQPKGEMIIQKIYDRLPGYHDCGAIAIHYSFPSGIQGQEHPNPGRRYDGTQRTAYLPDNREGREVLQLLRRAFDARLVFTVGTSVTTGRSNQVTWNDIHHKTSTHGGPEGFGYPDPHYLRRVKEELAAKGIS